MLRNRIIYLVSLISTGVFASFFGGNIPYILFYTTLFLPLFCFAYTLYVNFRFKINQTIPRVRLIKKESIPYQLILANEDIFTFTSIKVSYFDEKSHIQQSKESDVYCLGPRSSKSILGSVYGEYRGTYEIGAESVVITDFLELFSITYPIRSTLRLIVSPRILNLEKLKLTTFIKDSENTRFNLNPVNEVIDTELRKYVKGDNRKLIHWKASAKKQELLTKKTTDLEEFETFLFLDLQKASEDEYCNFIAEDKIIELALAITNHFFQDKIPLRIFYEHSGEKEIVVNRKKDLENFYEQYDAFNFHGKIPFHLLIEESSKNYLENDYYIMISTKMNIEIFHQLLLLRKKGNQITFFYIRILQDDNMNHMLEALHEIGITVYDIWMDEDLLKLYGA